ncbi:MAG: type II secretion system F family protein [Pirellulales bacterium]|nr:type II secretion system F family protein [Pirellulales bacterium]
MSPLLIGVAAFVGVAALVGGVAMMLRDRPSSKIEGRLDFMTGATSSSAKSPKTPGSVLAEPLGDTPGFLETAIGKFGNINVLFEQADTSMTVTRLALACLILAVVGGGAGAAMGVHVFLLPVMALGMGFLPFFWLLLRRRRRMKAFGVQLPDALEMLARSLRAGQSLGSGFNVIAQEMSNPIAMEFGRVFEEQNLGISLEESLDSLCERVPNLDLKFFCTAIILQRQTGGDLAEILDKIGRLIRERFQIWGQVQALTGEGRLSGIILLALPIALFLVVYQMNPDYVMVLFTDPVGKKMIAFAVFLQVIGALVIRKIVNIKV